MMIMVIGVVIIKQTNANHQIRRLAPTGSRSELRRTRTPTSLDVVSVQSSFPPGVLAAEFVNRFGGAGLSYTTSASPELKRRSSLACFLTRIKQSRRNTSFFKSALGHGAPQFGSQPRPRHYCHHYETICYSYYYDYQGS